MTLTTITTITKSGVHRAVRITAQSLLLGVIAVAGYGCAGAETLTYSKEANRQGMSLYQDGDYVDAAAAFASTTRQNPRDYPSYYYQGQCYQNMQSWSQAISCYKACLEIMPDSLDGKRDLSMRYKVMDSLAMVISKSATSTDELAAMEKKCQGKPSVDDQWMLAKTYRYCGDADAAVEAYNKAVLIDPTRFEITKEAGLYEAVLGQNDRAAFTLKKAYMVKSDDPQVNEALHRLGVVTG